MKNWKLILLFATCSIAIGSVAPNFTYYHTTDEINEILVQLNGSCNGMATLIVIEEDPLIYAVDVVNPNIDADLLTKSLFIFGEHSRELISAETGLHLLLQLCGEESNGNVDIDAILQTTMFRIVLNSNPISRKKVENGEYCQRKNENDVDLNRNWDAHWSPLSQLPETYPGPTPFSEPETRALRDALEDYDPTIFLTIHSGNLGMYTPYAYIPQEGEVNEQNMLDILDQLNPLYCACKVGAAAVEIGTICTGTCLDYAYDNEKIPYSFAFEIYNQYQFAPGWTSQLGLLQMKSQKSKNLRGRASIESTQSCFVQTHSHIQLHMTNEQCLLYFNPISEEEYNFVVDNWTTAILEMVQLVNQKLDSTR